MKKGLVMDDNIAKLAEIIKNSNIKWFQEEEQQVYLEKQLIG